MGKVIVQVSCRWTASSGIKYFGDYDSSPLLLDDPEIVLGDRVTHLRYRVRK